MTEDERSSWLRFGYAIVEWVEFDSEGKGTLHTVIVQREQIDNLKSFLMGKEVNPSHA